MVEGGRRKKRPPAPGERPTAFGRERAMRRKPYRIGLEDGQCIDIAIGSAWSPKSEAPVSGEASRSG